MSKYNSGGLPWALGKDVSDCQTAQEVMTKAGLDWSVAKCELVAKMPFRINGNNNVICLENNVSVYGAEFHIEQDNNCLNIKKGTTFHGRNGYPVHIALDEGSSITINEDCMFSNGIQIRSTDSHSIIDSTGKRINYAEDITIGEHCWIGLGCIILKGTTIAPHTVVAA